MDMKRIHEQIEHMTVELERQQSSDGAWLLCLDSGTMTDGYFIIILRLLGRSDETFIHLLASRIASKQQLNGSWKIYPDELDGNLEATAEACFALLYAGYYAANDPRILQAKQFIRAKGGLSEMRNLFTQVLFSATGQAEWPYLLRIPLEAFFSNLGIGLDLFSLSGHARVHLIPILIMSNKLFKRSTPTMPDLSDLFLGISHTFSNDTTWISALSEIVGSLPLNSLLPLDSSSAVEQAETFLFERIEPNGTLLTYSTATMFMILAMLALDYDTNSPTINRMVLGVRSLLCKDSFHIQIASSEVWDTAMLSYALSESGVSTQSNVLESAAAYLMTKQQNRPGDWAIRNPNTPPGGWGFSDVNTIYPDVDCSAAALRAIRPYISHSDGSYADWQRGLNWVFALRNDDGGWPAFERKGKQLPASFFTFEGAADIATDPSTVDLTGRVLSFLGKELDMSIAHRWIDECVQWILSQQSKDGSWYGRWGISYIHGTGAAVQGMIAVGVAEDHPAIMKAVKWLLDIQNEDGGWGESCLSDQVKHYVPLHYSTPSQTAWALDALTAVYSKPTPAIERGIDGLLQALGRRDWTYTYPTGAGLPGSVYVHYPSNNYIWPMLTLAAAVKKYGT